MAMRRMRNPDWSTDEDQVVDVHAGPQGSLNFGFNPYGNQAQQEATASCSGPAGDELKDESQREDCWWRESLPKELRPRYPIRMPWVEDPLVQSKEECLEKNREWDGDNPYEPHGGVYWGENPNQ